MGYCEIIGNVPQAQKQKIMNAYRSGKGCTIKLPLESGNDKLAVTKTQNDNIVKAMNANKKNVTLEMSPSLVKTNASMSGGFLGPLLGIATSVLPTLLKTIIPGVLAGAASAGVERAIKGKGLYLKKGGCVCSVDSNSNGSITLKPVAPSSLMKGNGLYLKQGSSYVRGEGLILGPNSPFKNIPLLGMLL